MEGNLLEECQVGREREEKKKGIKTRVPIQGRILSQNVHISDHLFFHFTSLRYLKNKLLINFIKNLKKKKKIVLMEFIIRKKKAFLQTLLALCFLCSEKYILSKSVQLVFKNFEKTKGNFRKYLFP